MNQNESNNKRIPLYCRKEGTYDAIHKASSDEDRSLSYIIERAVRRDLKLDK